jgi:hypothetical protein
MAKLTERERAQALAREGKIDEAYASLAALHAKGDAAAGVSIAEVAAFRKQWSDIVRFAEGLLRNPGELDTLNAYEEMVQVVALRGIHAGGWPEIESLARGVIAQLRGKKLLDSQLHRVEHLLAFAKSEGKDPFVWDWGNHSTLSDEERAAKFEAGVAAVTKKKKFKSAEARRDHLISLADNVGFHKGAVALYDQHGAPTLFNSVRFVAAGLARAGRAEEAWRVLEPRLPDWWPVDDVQVAPLELLADEWLRPLMTPERSEQVLRTPRGPEGAEKKS